MVASASTRIADLAVRAVDTSTPSIVAVHPDCAVAGSVTATSAVRIPTVPITSRLTSVAMGPPPGASPASHTRRPGSTRLEGPLPDGPGALGGRRRRPYAAAAQGG